MQSHCGCEDSDCEFDPNQITAPHLLPVYAVDTVQGRLLPSVDYSDLGDFLFSYYFETNCVANAIC